MIWEIQEKIENAFGYMAEKHVFRYILLTAIGLGSIWFGIRALDVVVAWAMYSKIFTWIQGTGGLPNLITGAIAVWCVAVIFLAIPTILFSVFVKRNRKVILMAAGAISLFMVFLYGLSVQQRKNLFNPMTGTANYRYVRTPAGEIRIFPGDYAFDPTTGEKLLPLDGKTAGAYLKQQASKQQTAVHRQEGTASKTKKLSTQSQQIVSAGRADNHAGNTAEETSREKKGFEPMRKTGVASASAKEQESEATPVKIFTPEAPLAGYSPMSLTKSIALTMSISWCRSQASTNILCRGLLTNTGPEIERIAVETPSRVFDDQGNTYNLSPLDREYVLADGGFFADVPPGVPVAFFVSFNDSARPQYITLALQVSRGQWGNTVYSTFTFQNIPISR